MNQPVLECQRCGDIVRELTIEEARQVAEKPHNFVVYCVRCRKELVREVYGSD